LPPSTLWLGGLRIATYLVRGEELPDLKDEENGYSMNFVRNVEFQVKSGKTTEFTKLFANEVIPVLKQQEGFQHELAMTNGNHALGISVWKDQASAESYQSKVYPEVLKKLMPMLESAPRVETFHLASTTLTV
jgi:quinol monooxygenase YgiN